MNVYLHTYTLLEYVYFYEHSMQLLSALSACTPDAAMTSADKIQPGILLLFTFHALLTTDVTH